MSSEGHILFLCDAPVSGQRVMAEDQDQVPGSHRGAVGMCVPPSFLQWEFRTALTLAQERGAVRPLPLPAKGETLTSRQDI